MDCRWTRWILGAVCAGALGCSSPSKWLAGRSDVDEESLARSAAKIAADEPIPQASKLKPETWVSLGDVRVQMAADPNRTPADAERLREQAREMYQRALERDPKNLAAHKGLIRLYVNGNDPERAKAAFQKVLAKEPKNAGLWHDHGIYMARLKDWPAAIDSLQTATQLDPDNRIYCKTLGFTLARAGQPDEALPWLAKAMPEAQARLNLAKMLNHTQQREASAQQLELALRADPRLDEARAMLDELRGGGTPVPRGEVQQTNYSPEPARPTTFADAGVTAI